MGAFSRNRYPAMLPTDRLLRSPAPCIAASEENEYEICNRHPFGHDIDYHNRRRCAGWKRARSAEVTDHRHFTADGADACFADRASPKVFSAQVAIGDYDEIAALRLASHALEARLGEAICAHSNDARLGPTSEFAVYALFERVWAIAGPTPKRGDVRHGQQ
jgi:hypothetical protein